MRRCTICDKKKENEKLYRFPFLLKNLGYAGDRAHASCIVQERAKINKKRKRQALKPITAFLAD
jgi:predicted RNA-binding protein YlxR (DUF448 family)